MNKKAFTLVEVIVALGILALVFSGVVSLVFRVVNLEVGARRQTEAVALAQGILAEKIVPLCDGCTPATLTDISDTDGPKGYTYSVEYLENPEITIDEALILVKVTVKWSDTSIGDQSYVIQEVVRKQ